jgi:putative DNA primase/helicase
MSRDTVAQAQGKWKDILIRFGINPEFLTGKHGPCPFCGGGKDRFRWDDKDGSGSYFCSQCGAGTGMQFLGKARGWDMHRTAQEIDKILGWAKAEGKPPARTEEDLRRSMEHLLGAAGQVTRGTAAWRYLDRRCGNPAVFVDDLRAIPRLKHSVEAGFHPAILAILRHADGRAASVHRTFLTEDGQKAPVDPVRKMFQGLPITGSAVRLGPLRETLGIAEGIETAICAAKIFRLPVWSAISAGGMEAWIPPEGVKSAMICADNDASFTGQKAAYVLAQRLHRLGLAVEVRWPDEVGTDWADVWTQRVKQQRVA